MIWAQPPASVSVTASVSGVVYDSVRAVPLASADVQFIPVDPAAGHPAVVRTDATGRFRAEGLRPGAYRVGFFHATVDSLGITTPVHTISLRAGPTRVDLATPSPTTIATTICGALARDSIAVVVGFLRDAATGAPRADADVHVFWNDALLDASGVRSIPQRRDGRTLPTGWFGVCNVPYGAYVGIHALSGNDSTGVQQVEVRGGEVIHHDLAIGGMGSLHGTVLSAAGRPVPNARVRFQGRGDTTSSNDAGVFTFARVPAGSQTLEVRGVGYLPLRAAVHIAATPAPTEARVTLVGLNAFLDTVRVLGERDDRRDRSGFERRRRSSAQGFFLDRGDIERVRAFNLPDLLRVAPGIDVAHSRNGSTVLLRRRGSFCAPAIYVDGMLMSLATQAPGNDIDVGDILDLYQPEQIDAIEVYPTRQAAPMQFARAFTDCGTVVVWTRRDPPKRKR